MTSAALSITDCLRAIDAQVTDATAITRAALVCAQNGSESEAVRIAMDVDELLHHAEELHSAMRLIGERYAKASFNGAAMGAGPCTARPAS